MRPQLVVMAAGMGSRFGGPKQLAALGPNGETVLDYALYDARRAGIERVVFVIRKELLPQFEDGISSRCRHRIEIAYAFQEAAGPANGAPRTKPWGTGHAVLAARSAVDSPFVVINADDFYGATAFALLAGWLSKPLESNSCAMVAYPLANTLSEHGPVSRGICRLGRDQELEGIVECRGIRRQGPDLIGEWGPGCGTTFTGHEPVSMNIWACQPALFDELEARFQDFRSSKGLDPNAEFYLPTVVDSLLREGRLEVKVFQSPDPWFGVTYPEDQPAVESRLRSLVAGASYPDCLWD